MSVEEVSVEDSSPIYNYKLQLLSLSVCPLSRLAAVFLCYQLDSDFFISFDVYALKRLEIPPERLVLDGDNANTWRGWRTTTIATLREDKLPLVVGMFHFISRWSYSSWSCFFCLCFNWTHFTTIQQNKGQRANPGLRHHIAQQWLNGSLKTVLNATIFTNSYLKFCRVKNLHFECHCVVIKYH